MIQIKTIIFLCLFINLSANSQNIQGQQSIKKVIKIGLEYGNYVSTNSGSFSKSRGFTIGYLTGINIHSYSSGSFLLGVDFSYSRQFIYRVNVNYEITNYYKYRYVYDERYRLAFIQLGLYPGYYYSINDDMLIGGYFGSSIGPGTEWLETNVVSRTILDSTIHYDNTPYGVYGEYNMGNWRLPISYHVGFSVYYKRLMVDFRFTYTDMNSKQSFLSVTKNAFVQIGFVL